MNINNLIMEWQEKYPLICQNDGSSLSELGFCKDHFVIIAGPCALEDNNSILEYAQLLKKQQLHYMRVGLFKPRTSPYDFQGYGLDGLPILQEIKKITGIKIVSEITNTNLLDIFIDNVDIIQVGARSMQNFDLLKALGKIKKPILLKRGFGNSLDEWLGAAEYLMKEGNQQIILCERGIKTFETSQRNTFDLASTALLKTFLKVPVITDPSHATGISTLIKPLTLASLAVNANGVLIEIHKKPDIALSDGKQAINIQEFIDLIDNTQKISQNSFSKKIY